MISNLGEAKTEPQRFESVTCRRSIADTSATKSWVDDIAILTRPWTWRFGAGWLTLRRKAKLGVGNLQRVLYKDGAAARMFIKTLGGWWIVVNYKLSYDIHSDNSESFKQSSCCQ
eukprot:6150823-Amphidinium_carterae.3